MTTKLNVGQDFKLPLDVITMATAILGLRGSGKTNTAGVWTEELLKVGQQVIVIDPQNVWWGLKSSADGKQAGFPIVIFGGDHADVPITGTEGKQLADFVVENQVPCIFSLRHLSLNAQRKFVTALTEQIFYRKGEAKYQTPALVIIDEAHKFVPQKVQGDDMAMLVHRIQMLVTEGRASGIGVTLIDQRAATVNKDVLTQIELMVVHRTVGPQDKKALDEWIRDNAEEGQAQVFKESLAKLGTGEAWFWSVGWLDIFKKVQVRMRETFDSSRTPRPGEKRITPKNLAEVDLEKLKTELSETIEKAKADDPKELKKQIAELKRDLAKKPAVVSEPKETIKTVEKKVPVIRDSQLDKANKILERVNQQIHALQQVRDDIETAVAKFNSMMRNAVPLPEPPKVRVVEHNPVARTMTVKRMPDNVAQGIPVHSHGNNAISPGAQKILTAIAGDPNGKSGSYIAVLTGYKKTSRFEYIRQLVALGYAEKIGDSVRATPAGIDALGSNYTPLPTGPALREHWLNELSGGNKRIFEIVLSVYPDGISKAAIQDESGYQKTSVFEYCRQLAARNLVTISNGVIRASDDLF